MGKNNDYEHDLRRLQIGLVRYQQWAIKTGAKALITD
jgi:polyphosphate kinase 2 (PPK2 family)